MRGLAVGNPENPVRGRSYLPVDLADFGPSSTKDQWRVAQNDNLRYFFFSPIGASWL